MIFLKEEALCIDFTVIGAVFARPAGIAHRFGTKIQAVAHGLDAHVCLNGRVQVAGGIGFRIQGTVGSGELVGGENDLPDRGPRALHAVHNNAAYGQLTFIRTAADLAFNDFRH